MSVPCSTMLSGSTDEGPLRSRCSRLRRRGLACRGLHSVAAWLAHRGAAVFGIHGTNFSDALRFLPPSAAIVSAERFAKIVDLRAKAVPARAHGV